MSKNLRTLIQKLNPQALKAVQKAGSDCLNRSHFEIQWEHVALQLIDAADNDVARIIDYFDLSVADIQNQLLKALERFETGNTRTPVMARSIPDLLQEAWLIASLKEGVSTIRTGHLVLAMLQENQIQQLVMIHAPALSKVNTDMLQTEFDNICYGSTEDIKTAKFKSNSNTEDAGSDDETAESGAEKNNNTPALNQYTYDLTAKARANGIDPILGRDQEIRQMIDILMRRRQNNPILTGEAGVGKTALAEGLALKINSGDVPEPLRNVALHTLDLGLLQAGASVKGEFENRLKEVIKEVKRSAHPIILFIDEAHTMIGAGGQAGQSDAANLLKPALARGELRTIAATTWSEYKKYFEKDAALARRFQVVKVEEPDEERATQMLRGISSAMEEHHKVRILDEAIVAAVSLSKRYLSGRQLPDKGVGVLDTACARVALGLGTIPAPIEDLQQKSIACQAEVDQLQREAQSGANHKERLKELASIIKKTQLEEKALSKQWADEKGLVNEIHKLQEEIEHAEKKVQTKQIKTLTQKREALAELQGETPLLSVCVDEASVAAVISGWTGIPLGKMVKNEMETVLQLADLLEERVIGQTHALEQIAQSMRTARANLEDPNKPKGVFMLVGSSGVGKTETALALADILYGGEKNLITINLSEYQESHTVSGLKGSPPGYVGYGEGGVLTEAVRKQPYSVVLLDEVEKAHPDVLELFFQVFDKGVLDDSEGRTVNFKNTVIILTSNAGTDTLMQHCNREDGKMPAPGLLTEALWPELTQIFKPAFLGRLKVIPFYPVKDEVLAFIVRLKLNKIVKRFWTNHHAHLQYSENVINAVASRCTEVDTGARAIDNILTGTLLPELANMVLERLVQELPIDAVTVDMDSKGNFAYRWAKKLKKPAAKKSPVKKAAKTTKK